MINLNNNQIVEFAMRLNNLDDDTKTIYAGHYLLSQMEQDNAAYIRHQSFNIEVEVDANGKIVEEFNEFTLLDRLNEYFGIRHYRMVVGNEIPKELGLFEITFLCSDDGQPHKDTYKIWIVPK
jgi:hypothetical protein